VGRIERAPRELHAVSVSDPDVLHDVLRWILLHRSSKTVEAIVGRADRPPSANQWHSETIRLQRCSRLPRLKRVGPASVREPALRPPRSPPTAPRPPRPASPV